MGKLDIIKALQDSGVDHILTTIFHYLDPKSLKSAEEISPTWKNAIDHGKLWQKILEHQITLCPKWKKVLDGLVGKFPDLIKESTISYISSDSARDLYMQIEEEIKVLEQNWTSVVFSQETYGFGPQFQPGTHCERTVCMNSKYIVRALPNRQIVVYDRWNLEVLRVLELPIVQIWLRGCVPTFQSVKLNEKFITASFNNHSEMCIWNAETMELLRVLDGQHAKIEEEVEEGPILSLAHNIWKNLLFTCHANLSDDLCTCTLRSVPDDLESETVTLYKVAIKGPIHYFWGLELDDAYVVMCFARLEEPDHLLSQIEVRKTRNFDHVVTITLGNSSFYHFHYFNGLAVTGQAGKSLRLWNVSTGLCLRKIPFHEPLTSVRVITEKYLVSCDALGKVKLWDLEAAVKNETKSHLKMLLKSISPPQYPMRDGFTDTLVLADEFQIVVLLQFDRKSSQVLVYQFFGYVCYEERKKCLMLRA